MTIKIGIPRALLYYQYFPMWKTFFETLGAEVVVSNTTSKAVLSDGASRLVAETCLPVKVFCGHAASLAKSCDYLFIPTIRSVEPKVYHCSKVLGLPEVVKATVPEGPPILDIEIDVNQGQRYFWTGIFKLAHHLTSNPFLIRKATRLALEMQRKYRRLMWQEALDVPQALCKIWGNNVTNTQAKPTGSQLKVAIVGHSYLIYDEFITYRLVHRLETLGARVFTPEMVKPEDQLAALLRVEDKNYWSHEIEVAGAGGYYMENNVDGIVGVTAFGCGPDPLMMEAVERYGRHHTAKPFMYLTIDEHTAEAGLLTRLEAFLDMLIRRKRR